MSGRYKRHDTLKEPNASAAQHALEEISLLADAADEAELEAIHDAEDLAVSGPADNTREVTPARLGACRECGGVVENIEDWRVPANASEAWANWHMACVRSAATKWSFCPVTGGCWWNGVRHDFERRKKAQKPKPWDGIERRRGTRP